MSDKKKSVINFVKVTHESPESILIEGFDQTNFRSIKPTFSRTFSNPMSALISLEKIQETNKSLGLPLLIVEFNGFPNKFPEQKTLTDFN